MYSKVTSIRYPTMLQRIEYIPHEISWTHSQNASSPCTFPLFSSSASDSTFTYAPMNSISPPSHSANLNAPGPLHSSPPISDRSPSAPSPSTPTPPDWEALRFSSSRSRMLLTRLMASVDDVVVNDEPDLRRSVLWARINSLGSSWDGGREVSAWRMWWRCLKETKEMGKTLAEWT